MHDDQRWQGASINDHTLAPPPTRKRPDRDPYFLLWIVYLFFRPRTFFRHFIDNKWPSLLVACAWMFGMAHAAERFLTRGTLNGTQNNPILASWTFFWPCVLIGGAISGLLYFYIGGWWYRLRIKWSGDPDPDKTLARRTYLYAAQIMAIPSLIYTITVATMYATPADMANAPLYWWDFVPLVFVPWSFVVSFIGVRTVFDTGLVRSLIWFLILPLSLVGVGLALIMLGTILIGLAPQPPETTNPLRHQASQLVFDYPSNWNIDTQDPDFDPDYLVTFQLPQDAFVLIMVYASEAGATEVLADTVAAYQSSMQSLTKTHDLTNWFGMYGVGQRHTGILEGNQYTLTVFERPVNDELSIEVITLHLTEDATLLRPGFQLIAKSLNFTP